jgi:hypothetical protein
MSAFDRRRFLAAFVAGPKIAIAEPLLLSVLPGEVRAPNFALPDLDGTIHHVVIVAAPCISIFGPCGARRVGVNFLRCLR